MTLKWRGNADATSQALRRVHGPICPPLIHSNVFPHLFSSPHCLRGIRVTPMLHQLNRRPPCGVPAPAIPALAILLLQDASRSAVFIPLCALRQRNGGPDEIGRGSEGRHREDAVRPTTTVGRPAKAAVGEEKGDRIELDLT